MLKRYFELKFEMMLGLLLLVLVIPLPARAQFGGGTVTVFDPSMFARQLSQLQQETAAVTNLAQQLQYMIKNTTGGGAGVWQSNQNLLANLGGLIAEQQGLSSPSRDSPSNSSSSIPAITRPALRECRVHRPASTPPSTL